jgi:hypothetical protein
MNYSSLKNYARNQVKLSAFLREFDMFQEKCFFWHVEFFIRTPMMYYKASLEIKSHVLFIHIGDVKSILLLAT